MKDIRREIVMLEPYYCYKLVFFADFRCYICKYSTDMLCVERRLFSFAHHQ